jgi:hypothetical protein
MRPRRSAALAGPGSRPRTVEVGLGGAGRRSCAEHQEVASHHDAVAVGERHRALDPPPVEVGAVLAAEVLEHRRIAAHHDAGVPPRGLPGPEAHPGLRPPPEEVLTLRERDVVLALEHGEARGG